MANSLRSAMYCKMLCTSGSFQYLAAALQAFYICLAALCGKIRVFTVSLMTSAPAWISENIYIRCPKGKTFVYIPVITL